jgi:DNA-binding transcriptional ArsR family regulator
VSSVDPNKDMINQLEEQALAFEASAKKLRDAIAVLRGGAVMSSGRIRARRKEPGKHDGSTTSFILPFLRQHPHEDFDATEIYEGILEMGWIPGPSNKDPKNSLRSALARLNELGYIRRVVKGRYATIEMGDNVAHLPRDRGEGAASTP